MLAGERGSCPFCQIVQGEDQSVEIVCEDESWIAFFPLDPATPGHTLIIPRTHISDLWAAPAFLVAELVSAALRVGKAIHSAISPEGMNLITSAGKAAEQSVFHLHLHVVPRWAQDGFGRIWFLQVLLLPDYPAIHYPGLAVSFVAEVGLALWLFVKGVKVVDSGVGLPGQ